MTSRNLFKSIQLALSLLLPLFIHTSTPVRKVRFSLIPFASFNSLMAINSPVLVISAPSSHRFPSPTTTDRGSAHLLPDRSPCLLPGGRSACVLGSCDVTELTIGWRSGVRVWWRCEENESSPLSRMNGCSDVNKDIEENFLLFWG